MANAKLGRPSKEKMAIMRNQVSDLLWNGKLETTQAKAKSAKSMAEKIITLAINTYEDVVKVQKTVKDAKGVKVVKEVINDGPKKLAARRTIMSKLYDLQEQKADKESKSAYKERTKEIKHPLVEKLFNEYAPKYAKRAEELGTKGGYARITKLGARRGDAADLAIVELI